LSTKASTRGVVVVGACAVPRRGYWSDDWRSRITSGKSSVPAVTTTH
jgi:hypothetical protein